MKRPEKLSQESACIFPFETESNFSTQSKDTYIAPPINFKDQSGVVTAKELRSELRKTHFQLGGGGRSDDASCIMSQAQYDYRNRQGLGGASLRKEDDEIKKLKFELSKSHFTLDI